MFKDNTIWIIWILSAKLCWKSILFSLALALINVETSNGWRNERLLIRAWSYPKRFYLLPLPQYSYIGFGVYRRFGKMYMYTFYQTASISGPCFTASIIKVKWRPANSHTSETALVHPWFEAIYLKNRLMQCHFCLFFRRIWVNICFPDIRHLSTFF